MWITINLDNCEISMDDFMEKLPSKESIMNFIDSIKGMEEKWESINIKFEKNEIELSENEVNIKQI
jgi:hypothetical protein